MVRKFFITIGIIVIIAIIWLYFGVSGVIASENDVKTRFRDIVQYYVSMDQVYISPLLEAGLLGSGDAKDLRDVRQQIQNLKQTSDTDSQYEKLLDLQKKTINFLGRGTYPEEFTADSRFTQWSKNMTNFGEVSNKIKSYNESLSIYNNRFVSVSGKVASMWERWNHHKYLSIDGTQEDDTIVTF